MATRLASPEKVYVDDSRLPDAGRGVFAKEEIQEGALIEQCPVVALTDPKDRDRLRKTGLVNYYFLWGDRRDHAAICLGWGSVYNHSFEPNARYEKVMEDGRMDFYALRDIKAGEEILVNYNGASDNLTPLRIPGIPKEAGGAASARNPISGIRRRLALFARWLAERPGMLVLAAVAGA